MPIPDDKDDKNEGERSNGSTEQMGKSMVTLLKAIVVAIAAISTPKFFRSSGRRPHLR